MKMFFVLMSFILISCKSTAPAGEQELLSKLINVHKSGKMEALISTFGSPTSVEKTDNSDVVKYTYKKMANGSDSFETFVNPAKGEVISTSTIFWKSEDDYELLKKRFGSYHWIEKYIPTSPHPLRELYEVKIPELGISFEYDKLAPKIMWIFFTRPGTK